MKNIHRWIPNTRITWTDATQKETIHNKQQTAGSQADTTGTVVRMSVFPPNLEDELSQHGLAQIQSPVDDHGAELDQQHGQEGLRNLVLRQGGGDVGRCAVLLQHHRGYTVSQTLGWIQGLDSRPGLKAWNHFQDSCNIKSGGLS